MTEVIATPRLRRRVRPGGSRQRLPFSTFRRLARDPFLVYTAGLVPVALLVATAWPAAELAAASLAALVCVTLQAAAGWLPVRYRFLSPLGWSFLRTAIPLMLVWFVVELTGGPTSPLLVLYLPVVAAAAALGVEQAVVLGVVASLIFLAPEVIDPQGMTSRALQGVALAGVSTLLAVGVRQMMSQIERTSRQFRTAALSERRRSRQISGLEEVGRTLVTAGTTDAAFERVADVLVDRFGYHLAAIYLVEDGHLRLRAQRGYPPEIATIDPNTGVIGRATRTGQTQLLRDVSLDPDYIAGDPSVISEVAVPLVLDGELLGAVNVESAGPQPLDRTDRDLMSAIGTKIATALALARDRERLAELAVRDSLTGLHNRRYFDEALDRILATWLATPETERHPLSAVTFDLDEFGRFNKLHGVQVGDEALRVFARVLRGRLRQTDLVGRYGGEEFVLILEGSDRQRAVDIAEQIRSRLAGERIQAEDGTPLILTVSAGCAELDPENPTREELLRTADVALSMAKRAGRDRVVAA